MEATDQDCSLVATFLARTGAAANGVPIARATISRGHPHSAVNRVSRSRRAARAGSKIREEQEPPIRIACHIAPELPRAHGAADRARRPESRGLRLSST